MKLLFRSFQERRRWLDSSFNGGQPQCYSGAMRRVRKGWKLVAAAIAAAGLAALAGRLRRPGELRESDGAEPDLERVDEAGKESFPASDPPSWTLGEDR